jgi:predicted DNA-binding transcriptional regulator YafY
MIKPKKAKYFDKGMKLRLSSQKFVEKLDDGSIVFTVEYTQADEVLPLIQAWLPHLIILEPEELKEKYLKRLNDTLTYHKQ